MRTMADYDLRSLELPKLSGTALRAFAGAVANPLTRPILMPNLMKQGGFDRFRALRLDEPPTFLPLARVPEPALAPMPIEELTAALGPHVPGAAFVTVRDYAQAYRDARTTPEEVARRVLDAIAASDAADPPLRAFIAVDADDVLSQARASTARFRAGQPLSIFDGVPVAVKDEVDQTPYPTTVGTAFLGTRPADADATVVARLRAAGALLIGKANMHEIGINPNGSNAHYGPARNPYDPARDSGGSSSGPAVAVAAGLCPVAIGADGGGSIRIPASLCGQVGLKPTFGRVSEHGAAPLDWSVAHLGPIGATVEDVALAYGVIAGPDPRDPNSQHQPAVTLDGWNARRLERPDAGHLCPVVPPRRACSRRGLRGDDGTLRPGGRSNPGDRDPGAGCHAAGPRDDHLERDGRQHAEPSRGASPPGRLRADHPGVDDRIHGSRIRQGTTHADARPCDLREGAGRGRCDHHACDGDHRTAHPGRGRAAAGQISAPIPRRCVMSSPATSAGLPALSFPVGYDETGLPIGMQAMGRHWEEATLLRIAHVAEQDVQRRRPRTFFPLL